MLYFKLLYITNFRQRIFENFDHRQHDNSQCVSLGDACRSLLQRSECFLFHEILSPQRNVRRRHISHCWIGNRAADCLARISFGHASLMTDQVDLGMGLFLYLQLQYRRVMTCNFSGNTFRQEEKSFEKINGFGREQILRRMKYQNTRLFIRVLCSIFITQPQHLWRKLSRSMIWTKFFIVGPNWRCFSIF